MENEIIEINPEFIQTRIYTIRGLQVMLDSDLAEIYNVEIKRLNEQVKRNLERFPDQFMFQLTDNEYEALRSQIATKEAITLNLQIPITKHDFLRSQYATLENQKGKHRKYLPYAFTEQGVSMLSAVLRSETAIKVSIQIMNAFVAMRRFIATNAQIFQRLDTIEIKQLETDRKIENVLNALESKELQPKQGIFYDGQIFDAYKFVCDLIRKAVQSIILIDNYTDDSVLALLTKRKDNVIAIILTKTISKQLNLDLVKHNAQYPAIELKEFASSHDRFIIIDEKEVYHIGASLKDLGKKWFAFSKIEKDSLKFIDRITVLLQNI
ncbi:MAG: ORF6N domain-containing protein [Candidatus Kapabacteria bacterium]|nr:ORF6N domain-containing protein [Candidatus Kapabacteria bacterium]